MTRFKQWFGPMLSRPIAMYTQAVPGATPGNVPRVQNAVAPLERVPGQIGGNRVMRSPYNIPIKGQTPTGAIVRSTGIGQYSVPVPAPAAGIGGVYQRPAAPSQARRVDWTPFAQGADRALPSEYRQESYQMCDQATAPTIRKIICALQPRLDYHSIFEVYVNASLAAGSPVAGDMGNMALYRGSLTGGSGTPPTTAVPSYSGQTLNFMGPEHIARIPVNAQAAIFGPFNLILTKRDFLIIAVPDYGANATSGVVYQALIIAIPKPHKVVVTNH